MIIEGDRGNCYLLLLLIYSSNTKTEKTEIHFNARLLQIKLQHEQNGTELYKRTTRVPVEILVSVYY